MAASGWLGSSGSVARGEDIEKPHAAGELYVMRNTTGTPFGDTGVVLQSLRASARKRARRDLNSFARRVYMDT
jgi:hypothetical protein